VQVNGFIQATATQKLYRVSVARLTVIVN